MSHYRLALLGFGNVGQALAKLLLRKRDDDTLSDFIDKFDFEEAFLDTSGDLEAARL